MATLSLPRNQDPGIALGTPTEAGTPSRWIIPSLRDARIPFAVLLTLYAVLGCTVLRFNRNPLQILLTAGSACLLDMALFYLLRGRKFLVPLSAYISGLSLALLLNYSHNYYLLFLPVFLTIGSKYLFTYEGRHVFNPSMFGVALSLLVGKDLLSTAPAYQWGGSWAMSAFLVMSALSLFVFKIGRNALIISFLGFYILQILLRAYIMRWYLPPEALLLGTLTSAPFFLFVFFMITDPKTSPPSAKGQVFLALALTVVDLYLHRLESLYTFFYAAFIVAGAKFLFLHARRFWTAEAKMPVIKRALDSDFRRTAIILGLLGLGMAGVYRFMIHPKMETAHLGFRLEKVSSERTGIRSKLDPEILRQVDPRVQHIAKWLLSAGESAAAGDYDGDGMQDIFLSNALKSPADRNSLYRNLGMFRFERVPLPVSDRFSENPSQWGLVTSGLFVDYDNDGDQDLFLSVAYGKCILLQNQLKEAGKASFKEAPSGTGIEDPAVSIAANFLDFDRDGRLDLFVANAFNPFLEFYKPPRHLNIFDLPKPEYPGDRRMLPFMHASWDNAANGGLNHLYLNKEGGRFQSLDSRSLGMPETHWSLSVGVGDLNKDGWTDLYIANDFGPDDLYLNEKAQRLHRVQGRMFGSIGRDTYKGMNSSLADVDRNGYLDIYVSNVHMPLQTEGSLLWMTYPDPKNSFIPEFRDEATFRGVLNEHRFGWGASLGDLNNDGWLDVVQTNGMVDDRMDKRYKDCREYWYVNEKLMRSGPEIHTYADMWGDLRGYCINGHDSNKVYLSRGPEKRLQFVDVTEKLGWGPESPSRGALLADLDNDGDLDVGITHLTGEFVLYRNTSEEEPVQNHWLGLSLRGNGTTCNRDAAGSGVKIRYLEKGSAAEQFQELQTTNAFAAQGDRRMHFGLGTSGEPVEVDVAWCGGPEISRYQLVPDRYHVLKQTAPDPQVKLRD